MSLLKYQCRNLSHLWLDFKLSTPPFSASLKKCKLEIGRKGGVSLFQQIYHEWSKYSDVTRTRQYRQTLEADLCRFWCSLSFQGKRWKKSISLLWGLVLKLQFCALSWDWPYLWLFKLYSAPLVTQTIHLNLQQYFLWAAYRVSHLHSLA